MKPRAAVLAARASACAQIRSERNLGGIARRNSSQTRSTRQAWANTS